jgi:hypothetical protein
MSKQLAKQAEALREQHDGFWGEHAEHSVSDWQAEVADDDTRLGYWEWVVCQIEQAEDDSDDGDDGDDGTSSLLEFTFRLGPPGEPLANMAEVVREMDYYLTHDLISGHELTLINLDAGQAKVSVTLHHSVSETGAQDIASDLDYAFRHPDDGAEIEAEMLSVETR